jgi:hypothetical protein
VPIRPMISNEFRPSFSPEDVTALTAAFEAALNKLGLVDRKDPMTMTVAKGALMRRISRFGRSARSRFD